MPYNIEKYRLNILDKFIEHVYSSACFYLHNLQTHFWLQCISENYSNLRDSCNTLEKLVLCFFTGWQWWPFDVGTRRWALGACWYSVTWNKVCCSIPARCLHAHHFLQTLAACHYWRKLKWDLTMTSYMQNQI